ncbi:MAG: sulfatase-like hydrolase/transferase [Planctomycetota bacterium]|jgi:uncharacterized sulfatase
MNKYIGSFILSLIINVIMTAGTAAGQPPNILWITCEDISPDLGCYGDRDAVTPNLDRFAAQGTLYKHAFAVTGVCATNRTCLITGVYSTSLGSHNMRSQTRLPDQIKCFTEYLRQAGYYCTNNVKTDYNFPVPKNAWDESSRKAHWRNRKPGQRFFSVFNFTTTHESQIRCEQDRYEKHMKDIPKELRHHPDKIKIPPFHPDVPEVRRDWARYHDLITAMDRQVAEILVQLKDDGLDGDTIVFFFSDHGAGMPRCKKWIYDEGTHVPLIVRFPAKYAPLAPSRPGGGRSERLVSFVDFAPTVLSLAGLKIPKYMQGQAFLGPKRADPRKYVYATNDRMAERYDVVRTVRNKRYLYMRNYMPHLTYAQHISYTYQMPTYQIWHRLNVEGKLNEAQRKWFSPTKPLEELYDTWKDPYQINNLAGMPRYEKVLLLMRPALAKWLTRTRDLGFLPEYEILTRSKGITPYQLANDKNRYPHQQIMAAADLVGREGVELSKLTELLADNDAAVRYWAAVALGALGSKAISAAGPLLNALKDSSPNVKIAAAEALCRIGGETNVMPVLIEGVEHQNEWIRLRAANVLHYLGDKARPALPYIKEANKKKQAFQYSNRAFATILARFEK